MALRWFMSVAAGRCARALGYQRDRSRNDRMFGISQFPGVPPALPRESRKA